MRMEPWNNYFDRYTVFMVKSRYSVGRMGINVEYNSGGYSLGKVGLTGDQHLCLRHA